MAGLRGGEDISDGGGDVVFVSGTTMEEMPPSLDLRGDWALGKGPPAPSPGLKRESELWVRPIHSSRKWKIAAKMSSDMLCALKSKSTHG